MSGRVAFDSRGDAVWEWREEDGQFRQEASTTRVQKLQSSELSLVATMKVPQLPPTRTKVELPCAGFDPYDRGAIPARRERIAEVPKSRSAPIVTPPVDDSLSARFQRWLKSRRS